MYKSPILTIGFVLQAICVRPRYSETSEAPFTVTGNYFKTFTNFNQLSKIWVTHFIPQLIQILIKQNLSFFKTLLYYFLK